MSAAFQMIEKHVHPRIHSGNGDIFSPAYHYCHYHNELKEAVSAYKNRETGEMRMSSIWKEVENEGILKGKFEISVKIARNLLAQKILSKEEIAEVTGLTIEEVRKIAAGLCPETYTDAMNTDRTGS